MPPHTQRPNSLDRLTRALQTQWVVLLLVFTFFCAFFHVSGVDIGFHIRTGELVLEQRAIPLQNTFSFARGDDPWGLHQWAPGVVLYLVHEAGGISGLIVFKALLAASIFLVVWLAAREQCDRGSFWPFWAVTLCVLIARARFFERPFLFSGLMLALLVWLSLRYNRRPGWLWLGVPLFMAAWANIHLGVIYGFVYLASLAIADGLTWLGKIYRDTRGNRESGAPTDWRLLGDVLNWPLSAVLSLLAAGVALWIVNPHGPAVLRFPILYYLDPFWKQVVIEFLPPAGLQAGMLYGSLILAVLLLAVTRSCRLELLIPTLIFAWFAARTQRIALMYAIVAAPCLAHLLHGALAQRLRVPGRVAAFALPPLWIVLALFVMRDPVLKFGIGIDNTLHPRRIFRFLERSVPEQNMYNDMMYGGGILWWLYPKFQPFVDGRLEAYDFKFWKEVCYPLSMGELAWNDPFETYGISAALLYSPRDRPLRTFVQSLHEDDNWALVAFDDSTLLFLERNANNERIIGMHEYKLIWPGDWSLSFDSSDAPGVIREAERALALDEQGVFARTALARGYMVAGRYGEALPHYRALTSTPRAGKPTEADAVFDRLIEDGEFAAFGYYMKHFVAMSHDDLPGALRYIRKAESLEPGNPDHKAAREQLESLWPRESP
jgi:hypothetical protein